MLIIDPLSPLTRDPAKGFKKDNFSEKKTKTDLYHLFFKPVFLTLHHIKFERNVIGKRIEAEQYFKDEMPQMPGR